LGQPVLSRPVLVCLFLQWFVQKEDWSSLPVKVVSKWALVFFCQKTFCSPCPCRGLRSVWKVFVWWFQYQKKKMQNCVPKLESFVLSDSANQELSLCSLYKAACSELQVMFLIHYLLKYLNLSFEFWRRSDWLYIRAATQFSCSELARTLLYSLHSALCRRCPSPSGGAWTLNRRGGRCGN